MRCFKHSGAGPVLSAKGRGLVFGKLYIYILIGVIVLSSAFAYYRFTQSKIEQLLVENAQLETISESRETTINSLATQLTTTRERYSRLQDEFSVIRMQNSALRERLGDHDLQLLATEKPQLVENIINRASENALRCFELQSGAPLTEREINAQTPNDFNSECPWLFTR